MSPNCSISIEETSNGYVVRPLVESQAAALTKNAVVAGTLANLQQWIKVHFRKTACPECSRVAEWFESIWETGDRILRCRECGTWTVEGSGEWLEGPPAEAVVSQAEAEKFRDQLRDIARKMKSA